MRFEYLTRLLYAPTGRHIVVFNLTNDIFINKICLVIIDNN